MNLATSLADVHGVGPKTLEQFEKSGIKTVGDLVTFLPRKHDDFALSSSIDEIKPGKVTIKARCESIVTRPARRGMRVTTATLSDDTGKLQAVWFNQPYRAAQLKGGDEFYFSGEFEFRYNRYQLSNPRAEKLSELPIQLGSLIPTYPAVRGLKSQLVRKILLELKPFMTMLPETLPADTVASQKLVSYSEALIGMHFPATSQQVAVARERLAFEELFQLLLASQLNKRSNSQLEGWRIPFDVEVMRQAVSELPFALTGAQRRALWQIVQDFENPEPMNRLLQGDVGSGKTVVAGLAALQAARAGFQSALLAPTEILASQHANSLMNLLSPFGVTVGLATGSVKGKARETLYGQIAAGQVDLVVGTHALIQDSLVFDKLGFAIVDEQHRFGVEQRQKLLMKSDKMPHLLAMTATPIPRSLALTVYGELEMSALNEKPKGRRSIATELWSPHSRQQLYQQIDSELEKGRQAYVVCRLIDDDSDNEKRSVEAEYKRLSIGAFKHRRIGLLHGRLKPYEKQAVMAAFTGGQIDILVSTTVVEVGVDVPNATVIMIENADQFGLSQLHQLRGRVGRSEYQSYCYLVMTDSAKPSQRLLEIEKSNDGFYLAEVDMRLRGPGEVYGKAQHGQLNLRVASLADSELIERAQRAAKQFVVSGRAIMDFKQLAGAVEHYQRVTTLN